MLDDKDEFENEPDVYVHYVESRNLLRSMVLAVIFSLPVWIGLFTGIWRMLK